MKVKAKIQKWGNGLGLRVSGVIRDIPNFKEGESVEIDVSEDGFEVAKIKEAKKSLPFSEAELLKGMTPETAHSDILAKPLSGEF